MMFHDNAQRQPVPYAFGCHASGADTEFRLALRTSIAHQFEPYGLEECCRASPCHGGRAATVLVQQWSANDI